MEQKKERVEQSLARCLLDWYELHQRDLPWRRVRDPYRTWVSEIMLQQTRVETVIPYYERWMERFPAIASLAAAEEEEVLQYWQGLGYYSRARNLLQGVKEAVAVYGDVPQEKENMAALKGVGEYTAGAILSMAYNQPEPAVDGNVLRVFSRLALLEEDIGTAAVKRKVRELARQAMDEQRPGDFNQALMDLGAAVCIPRAPRCDVCPLTDFCRAYACGCAGELPVKRKKTPPQPQCLAAGLVSDHQGRYLLRRRPDKGLLAGMWEFPAAAVPENTKPEDILAQFFRSEAGLEAEAGEFFWIVVHTFSHRRWYLTFYRCRLLNDAPLPDGWVWRRPCSWGDLLFAGPHAEAAIRLAAVESKKE